MPTTCFYAKTIGRTLVLRSKKNLLRKFFRGAIVVFLAHGFVMCYEKLCTFYTLPIWFTAASIRESCVRIIFCPASYALVMVIIDTISEMTFTLDCSV